MAALWDDGPVMRDYVVGDLILEILGVWTLVLIGSGIYLFWPRRSRQSKGSKGSGVCSACGGPPEGGCVGAISTVWPAS